MKTVDFKRPDEKNLNIEIIKYRSHDPSRNRTPDRHRHNFHSIFLINKGTSTQEVDFDDFSLTQQDLLLIPKDSIHWERENHNIEGYTILFTDDFFSSHQNLLLYGLLRYAMIHRKLLINIPASNVLAIRHYVDLLFFEQTNHNNPNQIFILQNLMLALLNHLEGLMFDASQQLSFLALRSPFQRFVELVEAHYKAQKELDFYVQELGVTSKKLNQITKEIAGKTASQIIIDRIMLEAKRELCFDEKSIKEIAFSLGYSDQYYFSRLFKSHTQTTPKGYRGQFLQ